MATDGNAEAGTKSSRKRAEKPAQSSGAVRVWTTWTPEAIRSVERTAENGDLYPSVLLCEWLLTDDRIAAALDARIDALLGLEPTFELGVGRKKSQAAKALEADEDWWEAYPEAELRQMLLWGLLLGVSVHRHNVTERKDHGGRLLPTPEFWHPQTLKWSWQNRQWTVYDQNSAQLVVTPGDGEWILHTPFGKNRPWAQGLWRSLSRWALAKNFAISDRARLSSQGTRLVGTAPEGAEEEQRRQLANEIQNSGPDAVCVMASGFDIKMLASGGGTSGTGDVYDAQIKAADAAIAIRIRGGNLTTSVDAGAGSKAATEAQAKTGDAPKLKFDAASLTTTLHDQSLVWWAEWNFGDQRLAPWPVWPVEPDEDKNQRAQMVSTLGDGLQKMRDLGFKLDPEAVKDEFGLTFLDEYVEPQPLDLQQQGQPANSNADPNAPANDNGQPPAIPGKQPPKKAAARAQLKAETGALDGQLYVTDVEEDARTRVGKQLQSGLIADLLEAIQGATSYDEIRSAVLEKYRNAAAPEKIREYTRCALVMAELAGHRSVTQDMED